MTIHGIIKFKDAIIVDEKLLRELEEIILSFYDQINYSCRLCNDNTIDFESLEELLNYENTKIRKIVKLKISFGYYNEIIFEPTTSFLSSYKNTVVGVFRTKDNDMSILFSDKIEKALDKSKQSKWYTIITKISFAYFLITFSVLFMVSVLYVLFTKGINKENTGFNPYEFNLAITISFLLILFSSILSKCRNALLPPIAYKIGEQIKEIEKGRDLFSKVVWGVLIAFIVSLLAGKVF